MILKKRIILLFSFFCLILDIFSEQNKNNDFRNFICNKIDKIRTSNDYDLVEISKAYMKLNLERKGLDVLKKIGDEFKKKDLLEFYLKENATFSLSSIELIEKCIDEFKDIDLKTSLLIKFCLNQCLTGNKDMAIQLVNKLNSIIILNEKNKEYLICLLDLVSPLNDIGLNIKSNEIIQNILNLANWNESSEIYGILVSFNSIKEDFIKKQLLQKIEFEIEKNDSLNDLYNLFFNLGKIYLSLENCKRANLYFNKYLEILSKLKDKNELSQYLGNDLRINFNSTVRILSGIKEFVDFVKNLLNYYKNDVSIDSSDSVETLIGYGKVFIKFLIFTGNIDEAKVISETLDIKFAKSLNSIFLGFFSDCYYSSLVDCFLDSDTQDFMTDIFALMIPDKMPRFIAFQKIAEKIGSSINLTEDENYKRFFLLMNRIEKIILDSKNEKMASFDFSYLLENTFLLWFKYGFEEKAIELLKFDEKKDILSKYGYLIAEDLFRNHKIDYAQKTMDKLDRNWQDWGLPFLASRYILDGKNEEGYKLFKQAIEKSIEKGDLKLDRIIEDYISVTENHKFKKTWFDNLDLDWPYLNSVTIE